MLGSTFRHRVHPPSTSSDREDVREQLAITHVPEVLADKYDNGKTRSGKRYINHSIYYQGAKRSTENDDNKSSAQNTGNKYRPYSNRTRNSGERENRPSTELQTHGHTAEMRNRPDTATERMDSTEKARGEDRREGERNSSDTRTHRFQEDRGSRMWNEGQGESKRGRESSEEKSERETSRNGGHGQRSHPNQTPVKLKTGKTIILEKINVVHTNTGQSDSNKNWQQEGNTKLPISAARKVKIEPKTHKWVPVSFPKNAPKLNKRVHFHTTLHNSILNRGGVALKYSQTGYNKSQPGVCILNTQDRIFSVNRNENIGHLTPFWPTDLAEDAPSDRCISPISSLTSWPPLS